MPGGGVILSLLKISPLVFTTGLRITKSFHSWWHSAVEKTADDADSERAGNFEMYTLFAFDRLQATFVLGGSFLYTGLFVLYTAFRPAVRSSDLLAFMAVVFLAAGVVVPLWVNQWFKKPKVDPRAYCRFFHQDKLYFGASADEQTQEVVEESFYHPWISPSNLVLLSELVLLLVVGGLLLSEPFLVG